jgi:ferredoxin
VQAVCLLLYLWLLFHVSWPYADHFTHRVLPDKEWLPVEVFLWLDPLVGVSTALAARAWNVALWGVAAVLLLSVAFPRGFCGYLCPLGTLIDGFDALLAWFRRRLGRTRSASPTQRGNSRKVEGLAELVLPNHQGQRTARSSKTAPGGLARWANVRFHLLAAVLVASLCGVLLAGFVAALPVLTRGLLFSAGQLQLGWLKNWGMVPPLRAPLWVSLALFAGVFLLSLLGPRFWCRYVCPTGALLSLGSAVRLFKRRVSDRCVECGRCVEVCPFDAIHADFSTRPLACTFCQTCAGVCPTQAISFDPRRAATIEPLRPEGPPLAHPISRRALLLSTASGAVAALAAQVAPAAKPPPVRPPGSVPEARFLDLCIRCEQCLKVCPGPVLQAAGLEQGFEALWTPVAVFPHAGCHPDCNFCTQVCPTGAIQPLSPEAKRRARMGLAKLDVTTCLPHVGERDCQLCFDECHAAGYHAIEMRPIPLPLGDVPEGTLGPDEIEAMGRIQAPFVNAAACVGCGLCEYRCHTANFKQRGWLKRSAVVVVAENGRSS